MSAKKVIYLPSRTALPPGARLLTEEEAQLKYKDKPEWVEVKMPPKAAEESQVLATVTTLGDTEVWRYMQQNIAIGLDFGLDDEKPVVIERKPCGAWEQITDEIIKLRK